MTNDQLPNDELRDNIRKLVAKIIKLPVEKVDPRADLFTDLNIDSLVGMEIFAALDKQYGIIVPEERLSGVSTLDDITKLVAELLAEKNKS